MKKLTALILTLSMLLSIFVLPMGASAMTEDERKEILNAREQIYINIDPNIDAFASLETIRNYANTNNAVNSSDAFNKVTEVYDETGTNVLYTYMNRLLNETHDGKPITGNETYYKKGIASAAEDAVRMSPMLFVTESFKLTEAELKALPVKTYTDLSSSSTTQNPATIAAARYADPTKFAETTVKLSTNEFKYLPNVVKTETEGDNYYVTIKDPETATQFKLGPINDSEFVKNALDVTRGTNGNNYAVVPAGTKGKMLSYAVTTADVNSGGSYSDNYALNISSPTAALSEVEIIYADNYKETRYVLTTKSVASPIDDMVGLAIWSADKYDSEGNEITYTAESFLKSTSSANPLTALTGTNLTLDDIIFPENVDAKEINVAIGLRARQDTANNNYGNKAAFGTFELQDKEIKSINFVQDGQPGKIEIEGLIGLYRTETDAPRALIPVKLPEDKADANKVYFAYVGRFANSVALLGATVVSESLKDKIDALNAELSILDSASLEEEDIANYRAQIAEVKAQSEYILDSDFDTSKLDEAEERIEEEKVQERAEAIVNAPNVTQFPLSAATGANSRLFVKKGTESEIATSGYLTGIDFFGRLKDGKGNAKEDRYIAYSMEGETPAANLILKQDEGGKYVEITHYEEETKKYYINPDEKVIKIMNVDATEEYYGENAAAAASINGCTIDVPDGKYNSIGLLAGAEWTRPVKITLIYEDGEVQVPEADAPYIYYWSHANFRGESGTEKYDYYVANWNYTTSSQRGVFRFNNLDGFSETTTRIGYKEFTVASDPDRVLKSINFVSTNVESPVSIISLWGNRDTVAERLAELEGLEVKDEATLAAAKAALADFDAYIAMLGYTLADLGSYKAPYVDLKAEIAEFVETLKLKRNFPISVANGANAKLFIGYDTYQTYKTNQKVDEEWVKGLDFASIVKADTSARPHTSYPTGTDADTISGYSNALIYKVDKAPVTNPAQYSIPFVNLTTKNGSPTWTVNGIDFAINPTEKIIKVYTPTDASGVEDYELRARFATLDNPVLDIEDGCYESITVLAGANGKRTLAPTVIYKDGTSINLSGTVTAGNTYAAGESQDTGFQYLQALTNWGNTNSGGAAKFGAITITGFDTTKVVDKISFTSDQWNAPIFVISAFAETATIEEVLNSADASDTVKAKAALDIADDILAENNITADDLTVELAAKYNELKSLFAALEIEEVALENNTVTINYANTTAANVNALVIVAQYSADEKELISVNKYPVTFTNADTTLTQEVEADANNKVKVFVWKDLLDFFPLTANIYGK